ncbi:hypothetical protein GCM10010922_25470 [Microbacterium sorbitolivorans]|nr:hypothetical protein GCM10010922_25470 [Microbacterium sorbitolivorans]
MLARFERAHDEGAVRPALREDRDGVDVAGEHLVEALHGSIESLSLGELACALGYDIGYPHARDERVGAEELRELAGELSRADDA